MMRRSLVASVIAVALLLPFAVFARNFDFDYRMCVREAMNRREVGIIDNTLNHNNNKINAYHDHRARLFDAWDIENDKDRNNVIRNADKDFQNIVKDHDKNYKNIVRDLSNNFKNDERGCRNAYNDRVKQVPTGNVCFSSNECRPPIGYCTTETGECRMSCERNSNPCIQVCSGRCKVR
ncbi:MAG: hypothetical protein HOO67_07360 [Candidatus Peribacteraceae bacterium]|nr:hypothetical protein [Candidatus Peribacteraceae bacterium]